MNRLCNFAMGLVLLAFPPFLVRAADPPADIAQADEASEWALELQIGHRDLLRDAVLSEDGKWVVTASDDGTAVLWDAESGERRRTFRGHKGHVVVAAFSRDNALLATGGGDREIKLWNVATGKFLRSFDRKLSLIMDPVTGTHLRNLWISADNRTLIASSFEGGAVIGWEIESGRTLNKWSRHGREIRDIDISADETLLATVGDWGDGSVKIWDLASGAPLTHPVAPLKPPRPAAKTPASESKDDDRYYARAVCFAQDRRRIWTTSHRKTVDLWDWEEGVHLRNFEVSGGGYPLLDVRESPDGATLAVGEHRSVSLWDAATGAKRHTWPLPSEPGRLSFSADGKRLLIGIDGERQGWQQPKRPVPSPALLCDTVSGKVLRTFNDELRAIPEPHFSADGETLLIPKSPQQAELFSLKSGEKLTAVTWSGGDLSGFSRRDETTTLICLDPLKEILTIHTHGPRTVSQAYGSWAFRRTSLSMDGTTLVCVGSKPPSDKGAILRQLTPGFPGREYFAHPTSGNSRQTGTLGAALSRDGWHLITCGRDESAVLWDIASGKQLHVCRPREYEKTNWLHLAVHAAAFSPDGKQFALSTDAVGIGLWDTETGKRQRMLPNIRAGGELAWSHDGRTIVVWGQDNGGLQLVDSEGATVRNLIGHIGAVTRVQLSADDRWLLSVGSDGTARLWEAETGTLRATYYVLNDGQDWLVVTPDSHYDASPGGMQKVRFRPRDSSALEPLQDPPSALYVPGLLLQIFRYGNLRPSEPNNEP